MADLSETIGSDLPTLSKEDEAAFAAEEAAANEARAAAKGQGHQRLVQPPADEGEEPDTTPAPAPPAPKADAPAAQPAAPPPATPAQSVPADPPAGATPADDSDPDAVLANDGKRYVPLETMLARRRSDGGKIKDLEAALEKVKEQNDLLLKLAGNREQPALPAAAPPAPPPPPEKNPYDENTHPLEHERWERTQIQKRLDAYEASQKAAKEQQDQANAVMTARRAYVSAHHQFVGLPQNAGYPEAYKWLTEGWKRVAMAQGLNEQQALEAAEQMEWQAVQSAVQRKLHPSQVLWDIAKAAGWTPPAPQPAPATPAAAPATPVTPSPQKQIELAQQGAAAAISLSDAQGGSAPQPPTLASIAAMSKEDFHVKFSGAAGEEAFRKLAMGSGRKNAAVA